MQRAISGLCVAWKPLMAPHAMEMNKQGNMGLLVRDPPGVFRSPSQTSGISGNLTNSTTISATAMKIRANANMGYMRPMILPTGSSVAMI